MSIYQFLKALNNRKRIVVMITAIFLSFAILFSAIQPFKYGSSLTLLTVHSFSENTDPYVASKSNEYLSSLLAQIVFSNSFFESVLDSGYNIDKDYFSGSDKKKIKKWSQTVSAKAVADSGMISINIYHTDRDQAEEIARAITYTLQTTHTDYHGFGKNVDIKIIDKPITSTFPIKPDILLNLGVALAFGLIFSLCWVYIFPENKKKTARHHKENFESILKDNENNDSYEDYLNQGNINNLR
jgi:capsular polysaccharide biosynthesis protein